MELTLEKIILNYFFRAVNIKLKTWDDFNFRCYLIGIKLPAGTMIMLYSVKEQHIEKYIKHQNPRWIEMLPLELIDKIKLIPGSNNEISDHLSFLMMQKDITYRK